MTEIKAKRTKVPVVGGDLEVEWRGGVSPKAELSVILLHGWTLDRRMWAPQMEALSAKYPVIAIDRRGFGCSTAPAALHLEAEDVVAIQDFFCIRRSVIVGMSQAGRVALDFAARRPERTAGLVLQGAGLAGFQPPPKPEERIPLDVYRDQVQAGDVAGMREGWLRHPLMQSPNSAVLEQLKEILEFYDGRDLREEPPLKFGVSANGLDGISAPVLTITGDQETPWRKLTADAIAYGVIQGQRAVVENAGHICNLCNSAHYNALVESFLESLQAPD